MGVGSGDETEISIFFSPCILFYFFRAQAVTGILQVF